MREVFTGSIIHLKFFPHYIILIDYRFIAIFRLI